MKTISITTRHGLKEVIYDDSDECIISRHHWNIGKFKNNFYAFTGIYSRRTKKQKPCFMHRMLLSAKKGEVIDHVNRNGLDNRRKNIRICGFLENGWNRGPRKVASSKYKGVRWDARNNRWRSTITFMGKIINLGSYKKSEESDAAIAYNVAAKKYFGKFAYLNKV